MFVGLQVARKIASCNMAFTYIFSYSRWEKVLAYQADICHFYRGHLLSLKHRNMKSYFTQVKKMFVLIVLEN